MMISDNECRQLATLTGHQPRAVHCMLLQSHAFRAYQACMSETHEYAFAEAGQQETG